MESQPHPEQSAMIGRRPRLRIPQPLGHRGRTLYAGGYKHKRLRGHAPRPFTKVDANRTGQDVTIPQPRGQNIIRPPPGGN